MSNYPTGLPQFADVFPDSRPAPKTNLTPNEYTRLRGLLDSGEGVTGIEAGQLRALQGRGQLDNAEAEVVAGLLELNRRRSTHEGELRRLREQVTVLERQVAARDARRADDPNWQQTERRAIEDAIGREATRLREENQRAIASARFQDNALGAQQRPPERLVARIRELAADGLDPSASAERLNRDMTRTFGDEPTWSPAAVQQVLERAIPEDLPFSHHKARAQELIEKRGTDPAETLRTLKAKLVELEKAGPEGPDPAAGT